MQLWPRVCVFLQLWRIYVEWLVGQEVVRTNLTSLHHSSFVFFQTSLSIPSIIVPVLTDGRPLLSQDPGQPPSFPMGGRWDVSLGTVPHCWLWEQQMDMDAHKAIGSGKYLVVWLQGMWWGNTWVTCEGKASPPPCLVFCYSFFVRKILINCVCNSFALILVVKIWGGGGTSSRLWQTLVLETTAAPTRKDKLTHSVTPPNDVPTVSCLAPLFLMTTHLPQGSKSIFWCITRKSN